MKLLDNFRNTTTLGNFQITGTANISSTTINSTTLIPPIEPDISNLTLNQARVLALGQLPLNVNPVLNDLSPITGNTDPFANIKAQYQSEASAQILLGTADANGDFSIPKSVPLPTDQDINITSNIPFLYKTITLKAQESGDIIIESAPALIRFVSPPISTSPLILGRSANEPVVVVDTRIYSTKWELLANIDGPLKTDNGHILPEAVVYIANSGDFNNMKPLSPDAPISIYTGEVDSGTTTITWDDESGILLNVTAPIRLGEEYTAKITWTLVLIDP